MLVEVILHHIVISLRASILYLPTISLLLLEVTLSRHLAIWNLYIPSGISPLLRVWKFLL